VDKYFRGAAYLSSEDFEDSEVLREEMPILAACGETSRTYL
jgi:hypothetical protein